MCSAGNAYKVRKLVSATDSDNSATVDALVAHPNCNGRIGTTGMCYGGHLAFRVSEILESRVPHLSES